MWTCFDESLAIPVFQTCFDETKCWLIRYKLNKGLAGEVSNPWIFAKYVLIIPVNEFPATFDD